jgi:hypothetical protein
MAFRNAKIDIVNVFSNANLTNPSWTNDWQSLNAGAGSSNSHYAKVGQDNIVYFCDDRYVGSILEKTVFDPATGGTYTYNNQALDMPQGEINNWLDELGVNLLVAGDSYNFIYPWDRVSASYSLPINVPERSIKRIKNMGGTVYILAGVRGNIYTTQGTYAKLFKSLPDYVINNGSTILSNPVTWGGIGSRNGALIFGAGVQTSGNSGIYLLYPNGTLILDNIPSTGSTNATSLPSDTNEFYSVGYASGADYHTPGH